MVEQFIAMKTIDIRVDLSVAGWPITGRIQCELIPCPPLVPSPLVIASNTFVKGPIVAQRTGTIQAAGPVDPSVTSQPVTITGSTVPGQDPIVVDIMVPGASFQCNDGDTLVEVGVQINPTGSSPAGVPVSFLVAPGVVPPIPPVPPTLPVALVIATNTFV